MLATAADRLPTGEAWSYEIKWDGIRALVLVIDGRVEVTSRTGRDRTGSFPELQGLAAELGNHVALLDGEVVALDEDGRPSFQALQSRAGIAGRGDQPNPVVLMTFDILWLDGTLLLDAPYAERRAVLDGFALNAASWQTPPSSTDGEALQTATRELQLEGVVAKRLDSPYTPGKRSPAWQKVKHQLRQELVIGGWLPGTGGRSDTFGALLVGHHATDRPGLQFAGRVGTGFDNRELERLKALLEARAVDTNPFTDARLPAEARFVRPDLVAEVRFTEWTRDGRLRHPSYLGLRDDVDATTVRREA